MRDCGQSLILPVLHTLSNSGVLGICLLRYCSLSSSPPRIGHIISWCLIKLFPISDPETASEGRYPRTCKSEHYPSQIRHIGLALPACTASHQPQRPFLLIALDNRLILVSSSNHNNHYRTSYHIKHVLWCE